MKQVNKFENFSKESNFTDAEYLSRTAVSPGSIDFLPIWLEKFKDEPLVIDAINSRIK